jgi:hypothetical protein
MPEWVADDAVTLAPEHFSNRHFHRCAHLDGMGEIPSTSSSSSTGKTGEPPKEEGDSAFNSAISS